MSVFDSFEMELMTLAFCNLTVPENVYSLLEMVLYGDDDDYDVGVGHTFISLYLCVLFFLVF